MKIDNRARTDRATQLLSEHVRRKGVAIMSISKNTGIAYDKLRRSLSTGGRALRTDEFLMICHFLETDPMRFYTTQKIPDEKKET